MPTVLVHASDFNATLFGRVLSLAEADVISTNNAVDAVRILAREKVDLVIGSICHEDFDSLQFLDWVRATPQFSKIPVVIMACCIRMHEPRVLAAGADFAGAYPPDIAGLLTIVSRFIECD